mmetsp:Transcript_18406/g.42957  ORF Transcript_18406/g.42957 Transcript_18406/m.42957 type:complete len:229 (+) Transcript_18406:147-833(+)
MSTDRTAVPPDLDGGKLLCLLTRLSEVPWMSSRHILVGLPNLTSPTFFLCGPPGADAVDPVVCLRWNGWHARPSVAVAAGNSVDGNSVDGGVVCLRWYGWRARPSVAAGDSADGIDGGRAVATPGPAGPRPSPAKFSALSKLDSPLRVDSDSSDTSTPSRSIEIPWPVQTWLRSQSPLSPRGVATELARSDTVLSSSELGRIAVPSPPCRPDDGAGDRSDPPLDTSPM